MLCQMKVFPFFKDEKRLWKRLSPDILFLEQAFLFQRYTSKSNFTEWNVNHVSHPFYVMDE